MEKSKLIPTREVAQRLGVTQTTIGRMIRAGVLPATKVGRVYRVHESVIGRMEREAMDPQ